MTETTRQTGFERSEFKGLKMDWREHIESDPKVMLGKPVIKGTRLTVELILSGLAEGATEADLLDAYPRLKSEHIRAAQAFIAKSLPEEFE